MKEVHDSAQMAKIEAARLCAESISAEYAAKLELRRAKNRQEWIILIKEASLLIPEPLRPFLKVVNPERPVSWRLNLVNLEIPGHSPIELDIGKSQQGGKTLYHIQRFDVRGHFETPASLEEAVYMARREAVLPTKSEKNGNASSGQVAGPGDQLLNLLITIIDQRIASKAQSASLSNRPSQTNHSF